MTADEWEGCAQPRSMLRAIDAGTRRRKSRLFACACARRVWEWLPDPLSRSAVVVAERWADGQCSEAEAQDAARSALVARQAAEQEAERLKAGTDLSAYLLAERVCFAAYAAFQLWEDTRYDHPDDCAGASATAAASASAFGVAAALGWAGADEWRATWRAAREVEYATQADLLRDIFGDPFNPAAFDPAWRTEAVVALARHQYQARDFSAMSVMADALEDAGCTSEDILNHCRGAGPHVRGCHVVDLVLGKE